MCVSDRDRLILDKHNCVDVVLNFVDASHRETIAYVFVATIDANGAANGLGSYTQAASQALSIGQDGGRNGGLQ